MMVAAFKGAKEAAAQRMQKQAGRQAGKTAASRPACLLDSTCWQHQARYGFAMCVRTQVLRLYYVPLSLCRAWGGALAAVEAWEGPGRSPTRSTSRHPSSSRRTASAPRAAGFEAGEDDDEDDSWADRLWQDMQEHKRAAAAAAAASKNRPGVSSSAGVFSAGSSRAEAARERERKAAAAAAESARILKEEQAKDADWRAAMMRQVQEVRTARWAVCCWQL